MNTKKHKKNKRLTKKNKFKKYEQLSPFELKNILIKNAKHSSKEFLNAGRGNPNFMNTFIRQVFTILHQASLYITNPTSNNAQDLKTYTTYSNTIQFKTELMKYSKIIINKLINTQNQTRYINFINDFLNYLNTNQNIHDCILSLNGCFYPSPPRIQQHLEKVVKEFMYNLMFRHTTQESPHNYEYFATEGAAAGILYVFNTLSQNELLKHGDTIAIITPIFSPYLEMPKLKQYGLKVVELKGDPNHEYSLTKDEMNKLKQKHIKALFMVNPANPGAFSLPRDNIDYIGNIVNQERNDLIVVSDCVYSPFVNKYNSFMLSCPQNTIEIYSLSKYFGVTGWRLGIVMIRKQNRINNLFNKQNKKINKRYSIASLHPEKLTLMQRLVLDSRQVAEAHTGGLSTPQQALMSLFLFYTLHKEHTQYKFNIQQLLRQRLENVYKPLGYTPTIDERSTNYYSLIDLKRVAHHICNDQKEYKRLLKHNPLKFLFHLSKQYGTVLLPGKGFGTIEPWVVRISLANLNTNDYTKIGINIKKSIQDLCKKIK